ncbi:MAG: 2OG-Fe(II) oxygenase [Gammaproteobacteria bacterium]|nr:2OG-Fe(II) oxygenase [Gammaproteobacteria bacterium]
MSSETESRSFVEVKPDTFIFEVKEALTPEQCLAMVDRFESNSEQHMPGRIGQMGNTDDSVKKTTDLPISGNPQWQDVDKQLFASLAKVLREYREHFPFFQGPFKDTGYHLQRYMPGEYYHWHIDGGSHDFSGRQLVALWYLNDVEGPGGETEFLYQRIKVKPEQGKLVLFPPFWTHEHRAVELEKGVKYVATTWLSFA